MAEKASTGQGRDDAELLNQVRGGNTAAFGVLYQRHVSAVRRLARELVMSPAEADHLVAETFARVHDVILRGGGPNDAFRPYVLTALRRVAASHAGDWRSSAAGHPDPGEPMPAPDARVPDDSLVVRAFLSLPERWRAVLWHTDIEDEPATEIEPLLGLSAAGVADLRRDARDGLRQAVVRGHAARSRGSRCQRLTGRFDDYKRGTLDEAAAAVVASHLGQCDDCAAVFAALGGLTAALRNDVAPAILGPAALQYLLSSRDAIPAEPGGPLPADTSDFGPAYAAAPGLGYRLRRVPRLAWVGAGSVLAAGAIAAAAIAGTGAPGTAADRNRHAADGAASLGTAASPGPSQNGRTPLASPSASSRTGHGTTRPTPSASPTTPTPSVTAPAPPTSTPTPSPKSTPSPTPPPTAHLSASVSISSGHFVSVTFQVKDTGNAATGEVTATITLPSGATLSSSNHHGGWSCQSTSGGVTCQHAAIAAGAQATGSIRIIAGQAACGQSVQLAVSSGAAAASAESGEIQCSNQQ